MSSIARKTQRRQQVIRAPVGEPGDEISGCRRHEDGIGIATKIDMRHVVRHARISSVVHTTGLPDSAWKVTAVTKRAPALTEHDMNFGSGLAQQTHELGRLVRGDAAGHTHHDLPVLQSIHDIRL